MPFSAKPSARRHLGFLHLSLVKSLGLGKLPPISRTFSVAFLCPKGPGRDAITSVLLRGKGVARAWLMRADTNIGHAVALLPMIRHGGERVDYFGSQVSVADSGTAAGTAPEPQNG